MADESLTVLETERLRLRLYAPDEDAAFMLELLNDPGWIKYIGDRGVRTVEEARKYIVERFIPAYEKSGIILYLTETRSDATPVGICGLVKRDYLDDVDLGFALLERYSGQGYAREAAEAVLAYAADMLGIERLVAITTQDNVASARLLEKLGFAYERMMACPGETEELRLFTCKLRT